MAKPDKGADDPKVTDEAIEDLKKAKDEVETSQEADETSKTEEDQEESEETSEEEGKTDDSQDEETEEESEESSEFVKEFPNIKGDTLEEYARELEKTQRLSEQEGKRLSNELKALQTKAPETESEEDTGPVDPRLLYVDKLVNDDVQTQFAEFKKQYPQLDDPLEYDKFEAEAASLNSYYVENKKQILTAKELYPKVANILGWEPNIVDSKDKLNIALKDKAAVSKTTSSTKTPSKSKVTDQMVAVNRLMYPNKTDAEIIKELEPHVK